MRHRPARWRPAVVLATIAASVAGGALGAQDTARVAAARAMVSGYAMDSVSRRPLPGAIVQLVDADSVHRFSRTARADSLGRYTIVDVPSGRYALGFFHPLLDSLGIEPPLHEVLIVGTLSVEADVAIPSPARLRTAMCGPLRNDAGAVVVGAVRDANTKAAVAGATVTAQWMEVDLARLRYGGRVVRRTATTTANGWFMLCNVPGPGQIQLLAVSGSDSTDQIEAQVPLDGFLRRELLISTGLPARVKSGDGRLVGTVIGVEGRPLAGAHVALANGPSTRANERGEFVLNGAPTGTRMLQVSAIGYYPERRAVDVTTGTPSQRFLMSTMRAVLDTFRVTARALRDVDMAAFNERRRTTAGTFLMPSDIMRHRPQRMSDLFANLPGLHIVGDHGAFDGRIVLRGNLKDLCSPTIFIDGLRMMGSDGYTMPGVTTGDLDDWVHPTEIAGIEIYSGPATPAQFQAGMRVKPQFASEAENPGTTGRSDDSYCGAIVIWRK